LRCPPRSRLVVVDKQLLDEIIAKTAANSYGSYTKAKRAPIGTSTNLNASHSVVISRQFARARTPSITRDCGP
jgi:hypothetical protein